ncbi:glycosyl hydrolase family 28-related protein [Actinopolymorpha sp. B17G11]|uniref:glycosyl hydrolase family 28-related protein n=1 Tax=Actinopolymorpha sp. B17G11 TaxID=3160861 RepID=UPI0032E3A7C8
MALPVDYDTVTVRGKYVYLDGSPVQGTVRFTGKVVAVSAATNTIIIPASRTATLSPGTGEFTIDLPATDDPDVLPGGWTYTVEERFSGGGGRTFQLEVPLSAQAGGIDLKDVAPTDPSQPGDPTTFVTLTAFDAYKSRVVDVRDYGAVADDSTDNTASIQSALDDAAAAGGGQVHIPRGVFRTGPLTIGTRVRLSGTGFDSILKHQGGTGDLITTASTSVDLLQIADLTLDCWLQTVGSGAAGVRITSNASGYSSGYQDAHHNLRDLFIVGTAGPGVAVASGGREIRMHNVSVRDPRAGHGFDLQGTDNFYSMCTAATTRTPYHGFYIHGSNNRFVGCKAFYCGLTGELANGFFVDRGRNSLVGCEAQDNGNWGFLFSSGSDHTSAAGILADSNAKGGIRVDNSGGTVVGVSLTGFTTFSRSGGRYPQPIGIQFSGAAHPGSIFAGSAHGNTTTDVSGTPTGCTLLLTNTAGDQPQVIHGGSFTAAGINIGDLAADVAGKAGTVQVDTYATPGTYTWNHPAGAKSVHAVVISAGAGGGSGRRGAAGTIRCGGGGGGGGGITEQIIPAAVVGATETVTVGAKGIGGAAATVDSSNGVAGTGGGPSSFGAFAFAGGSGPGGAGTATSGLGGSGTQGRWSGPIGGAASTSGGIGTYGTPGFGSTSSGGAGGGVTSANVASDGGFGYYGPGRPSAWPPGGVAPGGAGTSGTAVPDGVPAAGGSGGGGAGSTTTAGGAGGHAGNYGSGGGGGGASTNGFNSGAGGNGGDGIVVVTTYF